MRLVTLALLPLLLAADNPNSYLAYVRQEAQKLRGADRPAATLDEWSTQRTKLRQQLLAAWGGFPTTHAPLDVQRHGQLDRDEYTIENLSFQTLPGVRMTANAYVPKTRKGKVPALLMVHGHWRFAKQDPTVQSRCIGAAKLGFFVLCVDAFGAGERGIAPALGEYHGQMVAATLFPLGRPLSGIQVYENMRAVDYLLTRPEVDGERLGISGASGGGNQTMYAGAFDERFKAVVPVCSVGNYQAYLGAACCMCEVVPGALQFTEEGAVLALVAPRALMVISATKDAPQFSVDAAKKSLAFAKPIFNLHKSDVNIRHTIIDSGHDYNRPMREAMYGWMTKHLKGEGNGDPIAEPPIRTEEPETLRCFPGDSRPTDFLTLPRFAKQHGEQLVKSHTLPSRFDDWKSWSITHRTRIERVLGPTDTNEPLPKFESRGGDPVVIVMSDSPRGSALADSLRRRRCEVIQFQPRSTGNDAWTSDAIGRAPDHTSAEWSLWLGRPLLSQWVSQVRSVVSALKTGEKQQGRSTPIIVVGDGAFGLAALAAAAVDPRIDRAASLGSLATWVTDEPYVRQRLGVMVPGVLRDVGDVAHLAAAIAPRRAAIIGSVSPSGWPLSQESLDATFAPTRTVYSIAEVKDRLLLKQTIATDELVTWLKSR